MFLPNLTHFLVEIKVKWFLPCHKSLKHFFLSRCCRNCKKIEVYIKQSARYCYTHTNTHILHMYLRLLNLCLPLGYDNIQMNANVMTPNALVMTIFYL